MTESNKILTVSYGTFSCTLEGFDDPFGTMRGIAEYFRDLAAEDRYFGAEPPTPDVEMLQNIAQRDVRRRVDARIGDGGVALRATDADVVEDAEIAEPAPAAEAPVTQAPAPDAQTEAVEAEVDVDVSDTAPLAFDDEYLMADEPEDAFVIDTKATIDAEPAPESIAEKLRRIRAVVSRNLETPAEETNLFAEPRSDEGSAFAAPPEKRERALSETIRSITADIGDNDDIDALNPADPDPEVEAETDGGVDAEDEFEAEYEAEVEVQADAEVEATPLYEDEVEVEVEAEADDANALSEVPAEVSDALPAEDAAEEKDIDQANILAGVLAATASMENDRDDPDAIEETSADQDVAESVAADLTADETVAEDEPQDGPVSDNTVDAKEDGADTTDKAAQLEPLSETNGNVGRLLKETDEKFAEDDGIRRRRVISQMRAAVAATKAERILSKPVSPDQLAKEEQSPYRRDLDKVMPGDISANSDDAPNEPVAAPDVAEVVEETSDVPTPKAAPLVLVSSQRVDDAPAKVAVPTKPEKRVDSEAGTFAAFAEEMGAEELPDLLEAAAAFSAFVEGQPHFSRPDIMKRVARVDPALSLSREAGLRSFGMLLRQGKIRKLQRGQFTIAEDTRFNPAHRIAGQ